MTSATALPFKVGDRVEYDEGRWHRAPEPVEEPEYCDLCGGYGHGSLNCTAEDWGDEDEDGPEPDTESELY